MVMVWVVGLSFIIWLSWCRDIVLLLVLVIVLNEWRDLMVCICWFEVMMVCILVMVVGLCYWVVLKEMLLV